MKPIHRLRSLLTVLLPAVVLLSASLPVQAGPPQPATYPDLPSETPATLKPATASFDYVRRDVMIPMRDGVKLHTVILVPKGAHARADPAHAHAVQRRRP